MKYLTVIPLRIRILLSAALAVLAFLFLGAVRIQDSIRTRQTDQDAAMERCRTILSVWNGTLPERDRAAWETLKDKDPAVCLRSLCTSGPRAEMK